MNKVRIGKDITFQWLGIKTNGVATALSGRDLTLSLKMPSGREVFPKLTLVGTNGIQFTLYGIDHKELGIHSMTLWENYGKVNQTGVDKTKSFELVATTEEEEYDTIPEGLDVETISLEGGDLVVGFKGKDGKDGNNGITPIITTSKEGKTTTIKVNGNPVATINDGDDYVLTSQDKEDIANAVDLSGKQDKLSETQMANVNANLSQYATKTELNGKVDKETGKGLSSNDLTNELKDKIESAMQSLPSDVVRDSSYVHTDNNFTNEEKSAVGNIAQISTKVSAIEGRENTYAKTTDIADIETKTHASATYQAKGSYMADTPSGSPMHDLFITCGAVWNANSGYWEKDGLTDITTAELIDAFWQSASIECMTSGAKGYTARVLMLPMVSGYYKEMSSMPLAYWFYTREGKSKLEVLTYPSYDGYFRPSSLLSAFSNQTNLMKITNVLTLSMITSVSGLANIFTKCVKLEFVLLKGLKYNISIKDSPNLSKESILYMIQNASNGTTDITITLHATAYAMAMADSEIVAAIEANGHITLAS